MDGAGLPWGTLRAKAAPRGTRSPGTCRRHLTGEGFVRFRNSCPRGPQKNGRYGGNEKNTCKNFRKGVCCQPESSPVRRSVWERMEDKDVLIGCLCLFCFCGWEIRSGLELRKWKGLTGNEYCDHPSCLAQMCSASPLCGSACPKRCLAEVTNVMENGGSISMSTADVVANAMKNWALEKGATHYTHWFQPLTGITAEKHDSFLTARWRARPCSSCRASS